MNSPSDTAAHADWFKSWFNHPAYLKLYQHRSLLEAEKTISLILNHLDVDFSKSPKALDIACGSGRHAVALAENNFQTFANDLSEMLLEEAKQLAAQKNVSIRFFQKDMREIDFENEFDLIVQLFTSFGYFENSNDDKLVLRHVHRALKPKGWYVLDFFNASFVRNRLEPESFRIVDDLQIAESRKIMDNRVVKTITISQGDATRQFIESVRLYSHQELQELLNDIGFDIRFTFGDYHDEPFDEANSPRLIFIAQKKYAESR